MSSFAAPPLGAKFARPSWWAKCPATCELSAANLRHRRVGGCWWRKRRVGLLSRVVDAGSGAGAGAGVVVRAVGACEHERCKGQLSDAAQLCVRRCAAEGACGAGPGGGLAFRS